MKLRDVSVVMLALLLAAMAMVPMVSAVEQSTVATSSDQMSAPTIDVSKIQLPQLQFDASQKKVLVTGELSPEKNTQTSQIPSMITASPNLSVSKIPYGSIIHHSKKGVTTVFDSTGKQLFAADDAESEQIYSPSGDTAATFVHGVPSGSMIFDSQDKTKTYVYNDGILILTVIDETKKKSSGIEEKTISTASQRYTGPRWVEYAWDNYIPNLGRFEANWRVPNSPLTRDNGEQFAIWNGIRPQDQSAVIQPVLSWNINSNNFAWTISPWYYRSDSDKWEGLPRRSASPGDMIKGSMYYSVVNGNPGWWVTTQNIPTGQSTSIFKAGFSSYSNLNAGVVLEVPNQWGIDSNNDFPGDVRFESMIYQQNNGNTADVGLSATVDSLASSMFNGLSAVIQQNPSTVALWTPN